MTRILMNDDIELTNVGSLDYVLTARLRTGCNILQQLQIRPRNQTLHSLYLQYSISTYF